jgi:hypothetical protein
VRTALMTRCLGLGCHKSPQLMWLSLGWWVWSEERLDKLCFFGGKWRLDGFLGARRVNMSVQFCWYVKNNVLFLAFLSV